MKGGHVFIYDENLLLKSFRKAGFRSIVKVKYGDSHHTYLKNLEQHADIEWMKYAEPMILEGIKVN